MTTACRATHLLAPAKLTSDISGYGKIPDGLELAATTSLRDNADSQADDENAPRPALPEPGRYIGYVELPELHAKAAMQLDLLLQDADQENLHYRAMVKVFLGGFESHEFASSYFARAVFTVKSGNFDFGQGTADLTLSQLASYSGVLKGQLGASKLAKTTPFELHWQRTKAAGIEVAQGIYPKIPLATALTGSYLGECADNVVGLDVEAVKWRGDKYTDAAPLGGYRILGRLIQRDSLLCGSVPTCLKDNYSSGSYNYFGGDLVLNSGTESYSCKRSTVGFDCGACNLIRAIPESDDVLAEAPPYAFHERTQHIKAPASHQRPQGKLLTAATMTGQYYGYLHHEQSDALQLIALNVKAEDSPAQKPHVAAVATLYFGEGDSNEFIAYKFADTTYHENGTPQILDGDGESFMVISGWGEHLLRGIWYSKTYGRVGTVELQRDLVPELSEAEQAKLILPLGGIYHGKDWDFELASASNLSEAQTELFPLRIYGWAREKNQEVRRRLIEEGTYDFYSGLLAFRLDDGRTVIGRPTDTGMRLFWPPKPRYGTASSIEKTQVFKRVEAGDDREAKLVEP